jgi:hypothetical protein
VLYNGKYFLTRMHPKPSFAATFGETFSYFEKNVGRNRRHRKTRWSQEQTNRAAEGGNCRQHQQFPKQRVLLLPP